MVLDHKISDLQALGKSVEDEVLATRGRETAWEDIHTSPVAIEVPGVGVYVANRAPADIHRLAQAVRGQSDFLKYVYKLVVGTTLMLRTRCRATRDGKSLTSGAEREYRTFEDFKKDAELCLIGFNIDGKPVPAEQELAVGWAVFCHARYPKECLLFGRMEDVLNTGVMEKHGVTSDVFQGGILNPPIWNPFINDCWVLGGIKANLKFMLFTDIVSLSRKVSRNISSLTELTPFQALAAPGEPRTRDDIRADRTYLDKVRETINHQIITVTALEANALLTYGYKLQSHEVLGQCYTPDIEHAEKRNNSTLVDIRYANELMRVGQAIQNLADVDGRDDVANRIMAFIAPAGSVVEDEDRRRAYIEGLKAQGVPITALHSANVRSTDIVVMFALQKLRAQQNPGAPLLTSMRRTLSDAARFTADTYFERLGTAAPVRALLLLAIDRQIELDLAAKRLGSDFKLNNYKAVRA